MVPAVSRRNFSPLPALAALCAVLLTVMLATTSAQPVRAQLSRVDECTDWLSDELPSDQVDQSSTLLLPLCEAIINGLPSTMPAGFGWEDFSQCVIRAGGYPAVAQPGPLVAASLQHCTNALSSDAIAECMAIGARVAQSFRDVDPVDACRGLYQNLPAGTTYTRYSSCVQAELLNPFGLQDLDAAIRSCAQAQRVDPTQVTPLTSTLPGAEACLARMGRGPRAEDTAEARCAALAQQLPPGMDIGAVAACIGSNPDFSIALIRCVEAQRSNGCLQWDVSGTWTTSQANGYNPTFSLRQSGTTVTGTATLSAAETARAGYRGSTGSVQGTMTDNHLVVVVTWPPNASGAVLQGRYEATITGNSLTDGHAAAPTAPLGSGVSWTGTGTARCVSP